MKLKMGIGMIMPEIDEDLSYGHLWLYWYEKDLVCYRGYYYVENREIRRIKRNRMKMLRYFTRNCTKGMYVDDERAKNASQKFPEWIFKKEWQITNDQLMVLQDRCYLGDEDFTLEGFYSWNKKRPDWDNCSSWAIKVVCHVMGKPNLLICSSPKQFSVVKKEINWDVIPKEQ